MSTIRLLHLRRRDRADGRRCGASEGAALLASVEEGTRFSLAASATEAASSIPFQLEVP